MSFHRPWTRHVYLCCHKFGQKNHTTKCRVRRYAGIPVIRSKKHGYEGSGLGFHQNTMILHTRTSRHMKFRVHTWQTRQSTDRITQPIFSKCQGICIFTTSEAHNGSDHPGNINVYVLGFETMWSKHFLLELLAVLHFTRPPILFPNCLIWTSRTETMHSKKLKSGLFIINRESER
jgi:hypothetical protein